MIKPGHYIIAFFVLCGLIFSACTQDQQQCLTPTIASLNMECMHRPTDTSTVFIDTALPAVYWIAFTDSGAKYILYNTQNSNFTISLSSVTDSCRWGVTTDTTFGLYGLTQVDTLTFYYKRNLQFLSNACGYAYFYTLDSVHTTHVMIDSLHITNISVTNDVNTKQLQIFIHPDY